MKNIKMYMNLIVSILKKWMENSIKIKTRNKLNEKNVY